MLKIRAEFVIISRKMEKRTDRKDRQTVGFLIIDFRWPGRVAIVIVIPRLS